MGRIEALSYWVISDHFEELGRPPALLHGGFGLRTVGNLRKPRWWALELLERLGARLGVTVPATEEDRSSRRSRPPGRRHGRRTHVERNAHQTKAGGDDELARRLALRVAGLDETVSHLLRHFRVDATHSNISSVWESIGGGADWPNDDQWDPLRRADQLDALHPPRSFDPASERAVEFDLPMPGISYLGSHRNRGRRGSSGLWGVIHVRLACPNAPGCTSPARSSLRLLSAAEMLGKKALDRGVEALAVLRPGQTVTLVLE